MKPPKVLSTYQERFIEDNFKTMTDKKIGEELGLKETWVALYRSKKKMLKTEKRAPVVKIEDELFHVEKHSWI